MYCRSEKPNQVWISSVPRYSAGEALSLWRGDALSDVPAAAVQRTEVPWLAELWMRAVESRMDAGLRLGRHRELVAELLGLVGGEPLREGLHGQLMLALYRCGRQAEALEVFRDIDQRLRSELGISPGAELQHLHHRMLTADPSLTDGQVSHFSIPPERSGADFSGREEQTGAPPIAGSGPAAIPPTSLRVPLTSLVGRDDLAALVQAGSP